MDLICEKTLTKEPWFDIINKKSDITEITKDMIYCLSEVSQLEPSGEELGTIFMRMSAVDNI